MSDESKVAVSGVDFIMYIVRDLAKAREFYEGVFELSVGEHEGEYFIEYDLPDGNTFALAAPPGGEGATQCGGAMFAVPDVDAATQRVQELGGTFVRNYGGVICDSGWCLDPDGNPFGVHRRRTATA